MSNKIVEITKLKKTLLSSKSEFTLGPISFDIYKGEIIGIIGLNGAGKTTLLKLIMGLLAPNSGEINFLGDDKEFGRNEIGYFPESFSGIKTNLKVEDLLKIVANLNGISNNVDTKVEDVLKKVNNWENRNKRFNQLSKGMKTRVGIAQAILSESYLLILDEPTDGLDPKGRREVKEILNKLKSENKTIVLTSHNLSEVESICDKVIIINNGKILIDDTLDNIRSQRNNLNSLEDFFFNTINESN